METADPRWPLKLWVSMVAGIVILALIRGELPGIGFLLGIALVPVYFLALTSLDGPIEERTARVGAIVVSVVLVGAALWLAL
ncbi:hypothetical protein [Haloterrigena salifodinae]|uniref:hypothetical protein n=1 Tax=Haloterrigena salifodinae TaxID=2675099 RepID=UPI000F88D623|nr:hypothetical protein [Haloterrigena salifodinae]